MSRLPASSRSRGQPASAATRSSCTGTTRTRRSSAKRRPKARPSSSTRPTKPELAAAAGVQRVLVRVTLGVDADTHEAIRTGHHGSKFGLPPAQARALIEDALSRGLDVLRASRPRRLATRGLRRAGGDDRQARVVRRVVPRHARLDRRRWPISAAASGSATTSTSTSRTPAELARRRRRPPGRRSPRRGSRAAELWLEPGRSLVGPAGVTLYRVGAVKRLPERTWVAIDGGMSDNPRPQLYGARLHRL